MDVKQNKRLHSIALITMKANVDEKCHAFREGLMTCSVAVMMMAYAVAHALVVVQPKQRGWPPERQALLKPLSARHHGSASILLCIGSCSSTGSAVPECR
jgi:hypothetical protein